MRGRTTETEETEAADRIEIGTGTDEETAREIEDAVKESLQEVVTARAMKEHKNSSV